MDSPRKALQISLGKKNALELTHKKSSKMPINLNVNTKYIYIEHAYSHFLTTRNLFWPTHSESHE
jgi:hypothetical protein